MARGRSSSRGRDSERSRGRSSGRGRGNSNNRSSGRGKGGKNKFPFTKLGSISTSKDTEKEHGDLIDELIANKVKFWCKVYLPEDVDSVEIPHKTRLLISFNPHSKDPEFVLGKVYIPEEEEE